MWTDDIRLDPGLARRLREDFNPDEERDEQGKWSGGGGGGNTPRQDAALNDLSNQHGGASLAVTPQSDGSIRVEGGGAKYAVDPSGGVSGGKTEDLGHLRELMSANDAHTAGEFVEPNGTAASQAHVDNLVSAGHLSDAHDGTYALTSSGMAALRAVR